MRIHPPGTTVTALITAIALTACGSPATTATTAPPATAAASATASSAPGCAQAAAAVLAARKRINAQDYAGAVTVISDLRDATPNRKVATDAAFAATDLAFLSYDATSGNPAYQDLKDSLAALGKIGADCGA